MDEGHVAEHAGAVQPERRLLYAVYDSAVRDIQKGDLEAMQWVLARGEEWGGFRFVCDHLGLDVEAQTERCLALDPSLPWRLRANTEKYDAGPKHSAGAKMAAA